MTEKQRDAVVLLPDELVYPLSGTLGGSVIPSLSPSVGSSVLDSFQPVQPGRWIFYPFIQQEY
jgi:hypothetical protein